MSPDKNELIQRLNRKIEAMIVTICIIIITGCFLYAYIIRPIKDVAPTKVGYEKFRSFSLFLGDTTGTENYEERTVREYTDDWGIRHVTKERVK
jgi:hypothetical protein